MSTSQHPNPVKIPPKATVDRRVWAGIVLVSILGIFCLLWLSIADKIDLSYWFGVCGFKQKFGLPCPGCYITTSAKLFAQGQILESLYIQPAGAFFCLMLVTGAVFALLTSCFGVDFRFLHRRLSWRLIKYFIILIVLILLGGWTVTLVRAFAERSPL